MKDLKILELTNYSSGVCGVWQRVKQESEELSKKGYEVMVFSSNAVKGSSDTAPEVDKILNIKIKRFPFRKLGGESFMLWFKKDAEELAMKFNPDIIIAHSYRHPHTSQAVKLVKKLKQKNKKTKAFLVTHAPFGEDSPTHSFLQKIIIKLYDAFVGPRVLRKFDKILPITKWEMPYLRKLGIGQEQIFYSPNGIPAEFYKKKSRCKHMKNILFLGRISPIKDLEVLIKSMKDSELKLNIVGPAEEDYKNKLLELIKIQKINNANFLPPVYDLTKKIDIIDKHEIFVLPSKREGMPQSLIEAMARGKIVISSNNRGSKEIIQDNQNGFLFNVGDDKQLAEIFKRIRHLSNMEKVQMQNNARNSVKRFRWSKIIKKLEDLIK